MTAPLEDPFAPPGPDAGVSVATVVAGAAVVLVLALTPVGMVLDVLEVVGLFVPDAPVTALTSEAEAALVAGTAAPVRDRAGQVVCTRCDARVPYASMALSERGYFCEPCARALTGG